jgi:hypothetical protein
VEVEARLQHNHCVKVKVGQLCGAKCNFLFFPHKLDGAVKQVSTIVYTLLFSLHAALIGMNLEVVVNIMLQIGCHYHN